MENKKTEKISVVSSYKDFFAWVAGFVFFVFSVFFGFVFPSLPPLAIFASQLVLVCLAFVVIFTTSHGKRAGLFFVQSFRELRRISWPSRRETVIATGVVFVVVVIVSLFIWLIDSLVLMLISSILS